MQDARVTPCDEVSPEAEFEPSELWRARAVAIALRVTALMIFLLGAVLLFAADTATFRGNPAHTGVYDSPGMLQLKGVQWTFHADGQLIASPAVSGDAVYIAGTAGGLVYLAAFDGNFYAVDAASGHVQWKFQTGGERRFSGRHLHGMQPASETMPDPWDCRLSSPVVADNVVYVGSVDGNLYALD